MFLEPDKGDIYYLGDIIDIEYRSFSNSERVNIYLEKKGDIVFTVRENVPNNGVYKWNSPSSLRPSVHFQVKIVDASRTNVFILSERFGIIAK